MTDKEVELREDHMEYDTMNRALAYWAATHHLTIQQAQAFIQESDSAKRLVIESYWESKGL